MARHLDRNHTAKFEDWLGNNAGALCGHVFQSAENWAPKSCRLKFLINTSRLRHKFACAQPLLHERGISVPLVDGRQRDNKLKEALAMSATVLVSGRVFGGTSEELMGPAEILVQDNRIASIGRSVNRLPETRVIDLSDRTVTPGFIDTHLHLTMDAANLARQTLYSSATKTLKALSLAREYMRYGFTTLRDLGAADPEWPTVDLRNAINARVVKGPWLIVAAHILSASAGHGDLRGFYNSRWCLPVSAIADDAGSIKALVRREHTGRTVSLSRCLL